MLNQETKAQVVANKAAESSLVQMRAQLSLLNRAYDSLSKTERDSAKGQELLTKIKATNLALKDAEAASGRYQRNVGNYTESIEQAAKSTGGFGAGLQKLYGVFSRIANIIPGLGIGGLVALIAGPLVEAIGNAASKVFGLSEAQKTMNEVLAQTKDAFVSASTTIGELSKELELAKNGFVDKEVVIRHYNETLGDAMGRVDSLDQVEQKLVRNGPAFIEMQQKKAGAMYAMQQAAALTFEKQNALFELEQKGYKPGSLPLGADGLFAQVDKKIKTYETIRDRLFKQTAELGQKNNLAILPDTDKQAAANGRVVELTRKLNETVGKLATDQRKKAVDEEKARYANELLTLNNELKATQASAQEKVLIQKNIEAQEKLHRTNIAEIHSRFDKQDAEKARQAKNKTASLSGGDKDALKLIEAARNEQVALENKAFNEVEKAHKASFDEENAHLQKLEEINVDALNKKIALLQKKKNLNAEEKATLAAFQEQVSQIQLDTSRKIQANEKSRFDEQEKELKASLENSIQAAKLAAQKAKNDDTLSPGVKAQAQLDADQAILKAEETYYENLKKLNSDYNKTILAETQKQTAAQKALIDKDTKELSLATLADIRFQTDQSLAEIRLKYDKLKGDILAGKGSKSSKDAAVSKLDKAENVELGGQQLRGLNEEAAAAKRLLDAGLITTKAYEEIYGRVIKAQQDLNGAIQAGQKEITTFGQLAQAGLSKLFGFKEGSDQSKVLSQTIAEAFSTASSAMNGYFDQEAARIKQSLTLQEKLLDSQKEQALATAQSQAEKAAIEKQFAAKKEAAEREAFNKNKKLQIEQAKINLAMQLSNLAVVAFAPNPLNIATLGTAGAIMYGIQAALAFANYFANVSRINSAQFAFGGVPGRGGRFGGKPHSQGGTPFRYKGNEFEAELDELAIVRTRNVSANRRYTITGNHTEIASALNRLGGGHDFQPGGKVRAFAFGGQIGGQLKPPIFTPASQTNVYQQSNGISEEKFSEMMDRLERLAAEQSQRVDRLYVVQDTNTVTSAQKKIARQSKISTL